MRKIVMGVALALLMLFPGTALAQQGNSEDAQQKHAICHATGSETNPYVLIEPSEAGVFNGHLGDGHQDGEDIIPPFEYKGETYSQNWPEGEAVFNNGCEVTTTTTVPEEDDTTTTTTTIPEDDETTTTVPEEDDVTTTTPEEDETTTTEDEAEETTTTTDDTTTTTEDEDSTEAPEELPFTGIGVTGLALLATGLLGGGVALVRNTR